MVESLRDIEDQIQKVKHVFQMTSEEQNGGMGKYNEIQYEMIIEKFFQNWCEYDLSDSGSTSSLKHDK